MGCFAVRFQVPFPGSQWENELAQDPVLLCLLWKLWALITHAKRVGVHLQKGSKSTYWEWPQGHFHMILVYQMSWDKRDKTTSLSMLKNLLTPFLPLQRNLMGKKKFFPLWWMSVALLGGASAWKRASHASSRFSCFW